jgi:glycine/D-amino acid oxidase-like deaminating enzyme
MAITSKRDLRDGDAVWRAHALPRILGAPLSRSLRTDVAIVGAGISGAIIAQSLAAAGKRPLIVDRRREALLGSTAASTALLQFELDTPLTALGAAIGPRKAAKVWMASRNAVNELRTRSMQLGIESHFETRPSLYLAGNVLDANGLKREAALRQRVGLPSEYLDRKALRHHFDIDRAAALLSHGNAEANPVELAAGYLRRAIRDGAHFHAPHDIVDIEWGRRASTLVTQDGIQIEARHVIFCTGYEFLKIVPPNANKIRSTWAIATRRQSQAIWPQKALIWEASEPYLYLRAASDGRIICGGEDENFADTEKRDALSPRKTARLEKKLHRLFPDINPRAEFAWTGSFGSGPNGMPTIGAIPGYARCYAVMGYGGNGITFSMLAAKIIAAAVFGKKSPEAALFAFK